MVILYLLFFQSAIRLSGGLDTGANIHVCADAFLFFSYQVGGAGALLMGNGSHVRVLGVGTVILKLCRIPQEGVP